MNQIISTCLVAALLALGLLACNTQPNTPVAQATLDAPATPGYDSAKAKAFGADEYGMKKYVFAFLKKGPNRDLPPEKAQALQMAHLQNIQRMAKAGQLVLAGPFFGDGDIRGIYVFNVPTIAEAEALTNTDPAIEAGSLAMELVEWYGSAALMAVNDLHPAIAKKSITD